MSFVEFKKTAMSHVTVARKIGMSPITNQNTPVACHCQVLVPCPLSNLRKKTVICP